MDKLPPYRTRPLTQRPQLTARLLQPDSMASSNSSTTRRRTVRRNILLRSRPSLGSISRNTLLRSRPSLANNNRNTPLRSRPRLGNRAAHTTPRHRVLRTGPMRQASITVSIALTREPRRRKADPEQRTSRPTARQVLTSSLNRHMAETTSSTRRRHQRTTRPMAPCRRRRQRATRVRLRTTAASRRAIISTKASQPSKGATLATGSRPRGIVFGSAFRTLRTWGLLSLERHILIGLRSGWPPCAAPFGCESPQ